MPASLIARLIDLSDDADVVVPRTAEGYHPLCAVYARACVEPIARRLAAGRLKVSDLFDDVRTRVVEGDELQRFGDPAWLLANVNTPADYGALDEAVEARHEALHDHKL